MSWHLRKNCVKFKRPDWDSNLQSQQVQLLLEPIVDKKGETLYTTTKPLGHPVSQSVQVKGLFYIYSERRRDCS